MSNDILKYIQEQNTKIENTHKERIFSYIQESNIQIQESYKDNDAILGRIEATLMELNAKSQNGTFYDDNWYKLAIEENELFQKRLPKKLILGELDHPEKAGTSGKASAFSTLKVWREDNLVKGIIEVFNTSTGKDFWTLIKAGVCMGFSLRGIGSDYYEGGMMKIEGKDFELKGWDAVVDPSFVIAEFKGFVENKKKSLIEGLTGIDLPVTKLILESVNDIIIEEKKKKIEEFESKQLKILVGKQKNIIEEYKTTIKTKNTQLEEKGKEIKKLEDKIVELTESIDQKEKLLESKNKTNNALNSTILGLENQTKLLTEEINEKRVKIEKLETLIEQKRFEQSRDKIEIFVEKINKNINTNEKHGLISESIKSRQYKKAGE